MTRVAFDINLFEAILAEDAKPKSAKKLAEVTGCDAVLICKLISKCNRGTEW